MSNVDYYGKELETLGREQLRGHQDERLRSLMKELTANRFYQEKFQSAGINPEHVRRAEDLLALPFTTKSELVREQLARPPYGDLLTYPVSRYRYFHQTSGTTGRPLKWLDTEESWQWFTRSWGYVYRGAGVTEKDTVFCAFSFGPYISHWTAISGVWHIGAMAVSGGGMNSEQRLKTMIDNNCTVLVSTPTYALHLTEVARSLKIDLASTSVRITIHAGEPGASLPNVRRAIEESWGATCFDHAGATEVGAWAFGCQAQTGAIHLNEAEFIFEAIDPQSCRPVGEGERGELVITNLGRAGMPVLRYRTGDLVEMITEACPCGRTFSRIKGGVLGRADDMIIVRGVNLYPGAIDNLMRSLAGIVEYEVVIRSVAGLDDLLIRIESNRSGGVEDASGQVVSAFRAQFNIRVSVEQVPDGTLPRYEFKAKRYKRI
ncbi:MAG TPA: AMP-binding protein [Blastocatellia bacterium]|nr:AMP-binding protein [Blastocatellia bacterium]